MKHLFFALIASSIGMTNLIAATATDILPPGNVVNYTNKDDVVSYTSNKSDLKFVENLKSKYNGLTDNAKIDDLVTNQNYIEALNYLWTEQDPAKRLKWLEQKADQGHPIFMLELGEEYYRQDPTIETYALKTMPWLLAGARVALIDATCAKDKSVAAGPDFLIATYQERALTDLFSKYSQKDLELYLAQHREDFQKNNLAILRKVLTPIAKDPASTPSPKWIYAHGLAAFTGETKSLDNENCNALRKKEAQAFLDKADIIEKRSKQ